MTDDPRDELLALVGGLREHLVSSRGRLSAWGTLSPSPAKNDSTAASPKDVDPIPAPLAAKNGPISSPEETLRVLRDEEIGDCHRCPLGDTRIKLAFGVGNPRARVMLIGEGPGYMEDRQGEPFVGPAGQLLDKILDAIQLSRQPVEPAWRWVYIANIVKCHPMVDPAHPDKRGNDRPPSPEEIETCFPFLARQIRLIQPMFIVTLGAVAAKVLLGTTRGITALRGKWSDYALDGGTPFAARLLPTFHPAALLRDPALKRPVWEDMKSLRAELRAAGF